MLASNRSRDLARRADLEGACRNQGLPTHDAEPHAAACRLERNIEGLPGTKGYMKLDYRHGCDRTAVLKQSAYATQDHHARNDGIAWKMTSQRRMLRVNFVAYHTRCSL